jgi:hypothetical protein
MQSSEKDILHGKSCLGASFASKLVHALLPYIHKNAQHQWGLTIRFEIPLLQKYYN